MYTLSNEKRVPALVRAHNILVTLLGSPYPLGVSDLARGLDLSKSTVHGLVQTLIDLGLLEKEPEDGHRLRPAGVILALWREALLKGDLAKAGQPLLTAFSERHRLTALAGVFLAGRVLIVSAVLAPGFSISAYSGQWVPAWAGALGKVLLSTLPPRRAAFLAPKMAAHADLESTAYLEEVEQARFNGIAMDREEYLKGVRALAALVPFSRPFEPLGAVWTVGLAPVLDDDRLAALAPELKSLAEEVGLRMIDLTSARGSMVKSAS